MTAPYRLHDARAEQRTEANPLRRVTVHSVPSSSLSNLEIVTVAVYLVGNGTKSVDTEDVAIKAAELAPGRFSWRKYSDQINLELIRVFLSDAKKAANGKLVAGSGNSGWALTRAGLDFASAAATRIRSVRSAPRLSHQEKLWKRTEQIRLLNSDAYRKVASNASSSLTKAEVAAFFRVDDYVTGSQREQKVTRLLSTFGDDPKLGSAIKTLAEKLQEMG